MQLRCLSGLVGILCATVLPALSYAQSSGEGTAPLLRLRSGEVHLESVTADIEQIAAISSRFVIQLDGPITQNRRAVLEQAGVVLGDYIPQHAYIASMKDADLDYVTGLSFVWSVRPFERSWKVDSSLATRSAAMKKKKDNDSIELLTREYRTERRQVLANQGKVQIVAVTFGDVALDTALEKLAHQSDVMVVGGTEANGHAYIDAIVPLEKIDSLAKLEIIQFIEEAPEGTLRNDLSSSVVQSGTDTKTPVHDHGLHGENQIAGLIDGPPDFGHDMFKDLNDPPLPIGPSHRKVVASRNTQTFTHYHGAHTAGTLVGDMNTNGTYEAPDGIAFRAKLSFSDYFAVQSSPSTLLNRLNDAHDDGARVHSNSWGDDNTTAYTTWCNQIDQFSYSNEEDLVCFSCTNASYLRTPENAKNCLSVGATRKYPSHNYRYEGGTGPTSDGRRKPEIYAPGQSVVSATNAASDVTISVSGTSMACPAIAASAVLTRQYYTEGFYPSGVADVSDALTPSGALMKATLLNGAVDMTGITGYPSNVEGWGRLVLDRSLFFSDDIRRTVVWDVRNADGLSTGQTDSHNFTVWGNGEDLRVTMVFTDPPATVNASHPVVNNLDLKVTCLDTGNVYWGNYFVSGVSATGGSTDDLNNVEQVSILTPTTGTYSIEVVGTEVNQNLQGYALVVSGRVSEGDGTPWPEFADYDIDGDRDLQDFAALQQCMGASWSESTHTCSVFDIDGDKQVDLTDFEVFCSNMVGP